MPRDIPIGNGSLLVNFDNQYQLRDIYWPHVGQENHTAGHPFRLGVWVDGQFSWVTGNGWKHHLDYMQDTLATDVTLWNASLDLKLTCHDIVDFHENLYLREIVIQNEASYDREIRLFFTQDFHINGHPIGDSAYYEPERLAVFHYKGNKWFMINCAKMIGDQWELGVDQWAVGLKETMGREGTWRDAEDGILSGNAVAQGSIDSCVALHLQLPKRNQATGWYWIAVGPDFEEVTRINRAIRQKGPQIYLKRTAAYWSLWLTKEHRDLSVLQKSIAHLYRRSLLILRTQVDNQGAIVAATDFDVARYYSDTYAYMWPRDGALVAAALISAGYSEASRRFFNFCHQVITEEGYLLHKYNPDGSLASSWHGWYYNGRKEIPIQEDETALVIWALWKHFEVFKDIEFITPHFRGLIIRAAEWMVSYRDSESCLPHPSWDLWEERRGISAWTVGAVWGGLQAAANFADAFGEMELAEKYRRASQEIKSKFEELFWEESLSSYIRMLIPKEDGTYERDMTIESSLIGIWYFGMIPADHPHVIATMEAICECLWVRTDVGGLARYSDDHYQQVSHDIEHIPGNPWFICTLWLSQWYTAIAKSKADLEYAEDLLLWAATHDLPSGVMAEQVNPYTDEPISVSPLTWSHATAVLAVQEYMDRLKVIEQNGE